MKIIKTTCGQDVQVSKEDYPLLSRHNWYIKSGYVISIMNGRDVYMHRLVLGQVPPGMVADHIDRDRLNNQRSNLRPASHLQNTFNAEYTIEGKTSEYVGVKRKKRKNGYTWEANCSLDDKKLYIGVHEDEVECARLRDALVYRLRGEFAYLNFPDDIPIYSVWEFPERLKRHLK